MKKKFGLIAITSIAALFIAITPAYSNGEDGNSAIIPGPGYFGLDADPNFINGFTYAALMGHVTKDSGSVPTSVISCKSMDDAACKDVSYWRAWTLFPQCLTADQNDCIEEVTATKEDGTKLTVTVAQTFPAVKSQDFEGNPNMRLPGGRQTFLVRIPDAKHESGDLYLPVVNPNLVLDKTIKNNAKEFEGDFRMSLYAVKIINGNFSMGTQSTNINRYPSSRWGASDGVPNNPRCIVNDASQCAVAEEIPAGIKFGMKLRTSINLSGWFTGRISGHEISESRDSEYKTTISVSGYPVVVPSVSFIQQKTKFTPDFWKYYDAISKPWGGSGDVSLAAQNGDPASWSLIRRMTGYTTEYLQEFVHWLPIIGDKASSSPTLWNLSNIASSQGAANQCSKGRQGVTGVVTTNATQYIDGPPNFNTSDQSFNYTVASTHFNEKGELNRGTYDLTIKSDVARCLYKFSSAPISAKIEIVNESGASQVATTLVNEKNGWFYLSAKGFTYSNPTLKVILTQEKPVEEVKPTPTPTTSTHDNTSIKKTIACVKGKTKKVVTGTNPKCPAGYKKK